MKIKHFFLALLITSSLIVTCNTDSFARILTIDQVLVTNLNDTLKDEFTAGEPVRVTAKFSVSTLAFVAAKCSVLFYGANAEKMGLQFNKFSPGQYSFTWETIVPEGVNGPATFFVTLFGLPGMLRESSTGFEIVDPDEGVVEPQPDFVGTQTCVMCHSGINKDLVDDYMFTGHHYALSPVAENAKVIYPEFSPGVPHPPDDLTWKDIQYVIGGYAWSAMFVNHEGRIYTTGIDDIDARYNLPAAFFNISGQFVPYEPEQTEPVPFTCARCHATGYTEEGQQAGEKIVAGSWMEDGVGCEACHGPGSQHVQNPSEVYPPFDPEDACQSCHMFDNDTVVEAADGLLMNRQQQEELSAGGKYYFKCTACHNPHATAHFNDSSPRDSMIAQCDDCHKDKIIGMGMEDLQCRDCHMPFAVNAGSPLEFYDADGQEVTLGSMRSHLFTINVDAESPADMFSEDGKRLQVGAAGRSKGLTLGFVCQGCHVRGGSAVRAYSFEQLKAVVGGVHPY